MNDPDHLSCYACEYVDWLGGKSKAICGRGLDDCPDIGSRCLGFERYPGAPTTEDERDMEVDD